MRGADVRRVYCCSTAGAGTVGGLGDVTALAAGGSHQCARRSGGGVLCWGDNTNGQIGDRTTVAARPTPTPPAGLGTATSVTAGRQHSCAQLPDGTVRCWGRNDLGQLGDGTFAAALVAQEAARAPHLGRAA